MGFGNVAPAPSICTFCAVAESAKRAAASTVNSFFISSPSFPVSFRPGRAMKDLQCHLAREILHVAPNDNLSSSKAEEHLQLVIRRIWYCRSQAALLQGVAVEEKRQGLAPCVREPIGDAVDVALLLLRAHRVVRRVVVVADQRLPTGRSKLRGDPDIPTLGIDLGLGHRGAVFGAKNIHAAVDQWVFIGLLADGALPF